LQEPRERQQDRRGDADLAVGRQQADRGGADRHQRDGERHRRLAAVPVSVCAQDDAAKRTANEADPEGGDRQQQAQEAAAEREEGMTDHHRISGVHAEVVELERIAEHDGGHAARGEWRARGLGLLFSRLCQISCQQAWLGRRSSVGSVRPLP